MKGERRQRGRPCVLTAKIQKEIIAAVEKGLTLKNAAMVAGISYDTLNRWRNLGEQPDAPPEFCHFCNALKKADGKAVTLLVDRVTQASRRQWQAAAWILERRFPDEWGKKPPAEKYPPQPSAPMFGGMSLKQLEEELPMHSVLKIAEECLPRLKALVAAEGRAETPKIETGFKTAPGGSPFLKR